METATKQAKHTFGGICECGIYHYHCDICSVDCTMGTPAGPPTKDTDGKTRCYKCQNKHRIAQNRLSNAAPELLASLKALVSEVRHAARIMGNMHWNETKLAAADAVIAKAEVGE